MPEKKLTQEETMEEMRELLLEIYEWTSHKGTPWAKRVAKVLGLGEVEEEPRVDPARLPMKGECETCADRGDCPMKEMLPRHRANVKAYGEHYEDTRPDLWDEESIDEPEFEGGWITWCPMHCEGGDNA